jgi:hypothetical protein
MTDQRKSALEIIEAYNAQARSRRASSELIAQEPATEASEHAVRQVQAAYAAGMTTDGITVSEGGKVIVSMTGSKPVSPSRVTEIFGKSRVSIPEFRSHKNAALAEQTSAERGHAPATQISKKPTP